MKQIKEFLLDKNTKNIYKNHPIQMGMNKTNFVKYINKYFIDTSDDPEWDEHDMDEFKIRGSYVLIATDRDPEYYEVHFKNDKLDSFKSVDFQSGNEEDKEIEDFIDYIMP